MQPSSPPPSLPPLLSVAASHLGTGDFPDKGSGSEESLLVLLASEKSQSSEQKVCGVFLRISSSV